MFFFIIIDNFTGFSSQINDKKTYFQWQPPKMDFGFLIYTPKTIEKKTFFKCTFAEVLATLFLIDCHSQSNLGFYLLHALLYQERFAFTLFINKFEQIVMDLE